MVPLVVRHSPGAKPEAVTEIEIFAALSAKVGEDVTVPTFETAIPAAFKNATSLSDFIGTPDEARALLALVGTYGSYGIDARLGIYHDSLLRTAHVAEVEGKHGPGEIAGQIGVDRAGAFLSPEIVAGLPGDWGYQIAYAQFARVSTESQLLLLSAARLGAPKDPITMVPLKDEPRFALGVALHEESEEVALQANFLLAQMPWLLTGEIKEFSVLENRMACRTLSDPNADKASRSQSLRTLLNETQLGVCAISAVWKYLDQREKAIVLETVSDRKPSFAISALLAQSCTDSDIVVACYTLSFLYERPHYITTAVASSLVTLSTMPIGLQRSLALGILTDREVNPTILQRGALYTLACDPNRTQDELARIAAALGGALSEKDARMMGLSLPVREEARGYREAPRSWDPTDETVFRRRAAA